MHPSHSFTITRHTILILVLLASLTRSNGMTSGQQVGPFTPHIKQAEYIWRPEVSPAGPVVILVSLDAQKLYVYRNGVEIGRCTISSGKAGHRTPTGVFTILQKNVVHYSSVYHGASMPFMERLTWGGVAIHAGNLPGYPESHGCVHVPLDFAKQLYAVTSNGTTGSIRWRHAGHPRQRRPGDDLDRYQGQRIGRATWMFTRPLRLGAVPDYFTDNSAGLPLSGTLRMVSRFAESGVTFPEPIVLPQEVSCQV